MSATPVSPPSVLLRDEILALHAYHVPDSSGYIKLDAMENPYLLPQNLRDEIAGLVAAAAVNRYPDPNASSLKKKIRDVTHLPQGMDVLLGNGSDDIIQE
jgi:histidinol-phosphate aminotransferase